MIVQYTEMILRNKTIWQSFVSEQSFECNLAGHRDVAVDLLSEGGQDIAFATYSARWKLLRKVGNQAVR